MSAGKTNLPASVAARLLHRAKQSGDVYQTLLTSFCFERFLYRLGKSEARVRFVLKGAMLLRLWSDQPYRATRDLDLLRKGDGSFDAIRGRAWWLDGHDRSWTSVTFLLDREGAIRNIHPGGQYLEGDEAHARLEAAIERLLAEPAAG